MPNLNTRYMGLELKNPLVASASPLSKKIESAKELEEAGIGALVMYSLFEEQIIHESREMNHYLNQGIDSSSESLSYLPDTGLYAAGPDKYLDHLSALKAAVNIPVIGSLNGISRGGWTSYARKMEQAGADAIELNLYNVAADPNVNAQKLEDGYVELVEDVKATLNIPLAVKLSPFVTSLPHLAKRLGKAGADGLVLFNRFYQPDFDLETLDVTHTLKLSSSYEMLLPLRWISILHGTVNTDFALTSGVHSHQDVLKAMMAGAKVTMVASEFLAHGIQRVPEILNEMTTWMKEHDYSSIEQMQGSMSQQSVADPSAFERANYMRVLNDFRYLP